MKPFFTDTITALNDLNPCPILSFVRRLRDTDGTLWICGNGGSFATAQHWACDLSKAVGMRAQHLGANGAVMSAWANDADYADTLEAELTRLARPNDRLIALSCSGTSPNIARVLECAGELGIQTALLTGTLNQDIGHADLVLRVRSRDYGVIEDCFGVIGHYLTKELQT
jgi:D-sedoheptulose 7-phosphate isomerase